MTSSDLDEYLQLINQSRNPGRAKAHMLQGPSDLMDDTDNFSEIQLNPDFLAALTEELRTHKDVRRGDIIFVEDYLGCHNDGKLIFNGKAVIPLSDTPDEYGSIPEEFQAISEFPVLYWDNIISHNGYVPFNFSKHIPHPSPNQFLIHDNRPYFRFEFTDRFTYYIIPDIPYGWNRETFETCLKSATYFENYVWYQLDHQNSWHPPGNVDAEYILILPCGHIENNH